MNDRKLNMLSSGQSHKLRNYLENNRKICEGLTRNKIVDLCNTHFTDFQVTIHNVDSGLSDVEIVPIRQRRTTSTTRIEDLEKEIAELKNKGRNLGSAIIARLDALEVVAKGGHYVPPVAAQVPNPWDR